VSFRRKLLINSKARAYCEDIICVQGQSVYNFRCLMLPLLVADGIEVGTRLGTWNSIRTLRSPLIIATQDLLYTTPRTFPTRQHQLANETTLSSKQAETWVRLLIKGRSPVSTDWVDYLSSYEKRTPQRNQAPASLATTIAVEPLPNHKQEPLQAMLSGTQGAHSHAVGPQHIGCSSGH
jgi:hypothetical protein